MKASLLFLLCVAFTGNLFTGNLFAGDPVWIFNNGPDAKRIAVDQGQVYSEVGLTKLMPTGTDLSMSVAMGPEDAFPADARPFFAIRYKYKTSLTQAGLFFTTDTLTTLSDKSYSQFPIVGDNTWRTAVIDLRKFDHKSWAGTITAFRFDPTNPSDTDSTYQISRLGFFPTEAEAQQFLDAAVDAPDYSEPSCFVAPLERVLVPGGCLFEGYDRADFMLSEKLSQQPTETTVVRFSPKAGSGPATVVPVCQTNGRGFTRFVARKPGKYVLVDEQVTLDDIGDLSAEVQEAIRFVAARQLLKAFEGRKFRPQEPIADVVWNQAVKTLAEYGIELTDTAKPAQRAEAAVALQKAIQGKLGTAFESPYTNEYLTRDRIRIGAWVSPHQEAIGRDFIETYASGGFDWIIAHGSLGGPEFQDMLLRDCDKYGVELILGDGAFNNPGLATAEYYDHPCFAGTYVTDEPGTEEYDKLAAICNTYYKETGGKLPYINLLPMYANAAQLKYGAGAAAIEYYDPDPDLYKKYCDSFCEKFDPPYICTDIYPLNWEGGKRTTYPGYCESINIIAISAREHNKDFWCCIQTFAWVASKRTPTEAEYRWQSYAMLSFGCKGLLCWTYAGYEPAFPSLITSDGKRTNAWYDAATVFKEVRKISDVFVRYKNVGAMTHRCTDATPYLKFSNPVQTFPTIQEIQCEDPLLIGCFEAKEGQGTAFTMVNMSELEAVKTSYVKLKITGSKVIAWPRGERTELAADAEGFYRVTLPSGEGLFVEVE